jgi:membrane protein implicated in regulation of membrane protease activity
MDTPETWRWIWLAAAAFFVGGELLTPGQFFLLPFGIGAAVASVVAFAGGGVGLSWVAFLASTVVAFAALFPLRRRLDQAAPQDGIGARRLMGQTGRVLEALPAGETGLVRVGREEWRAESLDGSAVPVGATVKVVEVRGTRVIVHPLELPSPDGEEA